MGNRMVTRPIKSRDPKTQTRDSNGLRDPFRRTTNRKWPMGNRMAT